MASIHTHTPRGPVVGHIRRNIGRYSMAVIAAWIGLAVILDTDKDGQTGSTPPETADDRTPPRPNGIFDPQRSVTPAVEQHNYHVLERAEQAFEEAETRSGENSASGYSSIRLNHIAGIAYTNKLNPTAAPEIFVGLDTDLRQARENAYSDCRLAGRGICHIYSEAIPPGLSICWAFERTALGGGSIHHVQGASLQEAFDAMQELCATRPDFCRHNQVPVVCNTGESETYTLAP